MTIMSEPSAPLVVVVGATGVQGGSIIQALSESDKPYRIRGITRDASKDASQALKKQGVEMESANLSAETKDQIGKAFQGASIIFAVTNFWEHTDKKREVADGKAMVDAAKTINGLKLFIWSGLEDFAKPSNGKYSLVDHFDGKAEVTQYAKDQGLPFCNVQASMYMSNWLSFSAPKKQDDGTYSLSGPADVNSTAPLLDTAADYGKFVRAAIENPQFGPGSELLACAEEISWANIAKVLGEATGKKIVYKQITEKEYCAMAPFPERIAKELYEMYAGIGDIGYFVGKDVGPSQRAVKGKVTTWAEYVKKTDWSKVLN